jgi:hypothetical protein
MKLRVMSLPTCFLLIACGSDVVTQDEDHKYSVVSNCTLDLLTKSVGDHDEATLIVSLDPTGGDTLPQVQAAPRAQPPFVITIDEAPRDGGAIPDAVIVADTGANAAVDLALLSCNGIPIQPNRIELGTRIITPANRAANGSAQVAPGDAIMALTRMQHAALLTTKPSIDVVHLIGFIQTESEDKLQTRSKAEVETAAKRYPQVELASPRNAELDDTSASTLAQDMIKQGCRVIIAACSDPTITKTILAECNKATDQPALLIVLDPLLSDEHYTCVIGCSPKSTGRTAASMARQLLPEGGKMVTCVARSSNNTADVIANRCVRSFCESMGFTSDRLQLR